MHDCAGTWQNRENSVPFGMGWGNGNGSVFPCFDCVLPEQGMLDLFGGDVYTEDSRLGEHILHYPSEHPLAAADVRTGEAVPA